MMYEDDADMHTLWSEATEHTRAYDDAAVLRILAEVAELRKDRARLDLLSTGDYELDWRFKEMVGPILYEHDGRNHHHGADLRAAIDAAMESA